VEAVEGKTAVVTGAGSGIGRAMGLRFAEAGMNVALADIAAEPLERSVAEARRSGVRAVGVVTDVADFDQVLALRDVALNEFGTVHVLCNNAGVGGRGDTIEAWRDAVAVLLFGAVHGQLAFLPHLREHGDAHIVNTASLAGLRALAGGTPYTAAKHGVVGLTEGLYHDLARAGSTVGVSCLCPDFVATNMTGGQGRDPAEVADLVLDAILTGRFWIYTSDETRSKLEARCRSVLEGSNPVTEELRWPEPPKPSGSP
jgi:NAD(P)-dependent dehydrogenase (short-subunit alcohol dehydrogenase family)